MSSWAVRNHNRAFFDILTNILQNILTIILSCSPNLSFCTAAKFLFIYFRVSIDTYICNHFSFFLHVSSLLFWLSHSVKVVWKLLCPAVCPTLLHNSKLGHHNTNIAGRSGSLALNQIKTLQVLTLQTSPLLSHCLVNVFLFFLFLRFWSSVLQEDTELGDRVAADTFCPSEEPWTCVYCFNMESCGSSNNFL